MIEDCLITALRSDTALSALVGAFGGQVAIFSDLAPETAERPYITTEIEKRGADEYLIDEFYVEMHYWSTGNSRANARAACERIEFVLDGVSLQNSRYSDIRFRRDFYRQVQDPDPRNIHYVVQMTARGTRKKWAEQL